jgi:Uma2 family endonuclease
MAVVDVYAELPGELRPLLRTEFERLAEQGAFEDENVELLEGVLVEMSPEGTEHAWVVQQLIKLLSRGLPDELSLRAAAPWAASARSEPQPDLAVVPAANYRSDHPSDARLLIEVAYSSRRKDLMVKARIYAAVGVPEYWVIDLVDRVVIRHVDPVPDAGYGTVTRHHQDDSLEVEGVSVDLRPLLSD